MIACSNSSLAANFVLRFDAESDPGAGSDSSLIFMFRRDLAPKTGFHFSGSCPCRTATDGMAQPTFFKQPPSSTLAEIAALTKAHLVDPSRAGQADQGLASLDEAGTVPT